MMVNSDAKRRAIEILKSFLEVPEHLDLNPKGEPIGIQLFQSGFSDREMECFRHFTEIEAISVGQCSGVTDAGLEYISDLRKLRFLDLHQTGITNAGLTYLKNLQNLQTLDLTGNQITDEGICQLEGLSKLKKLLIDEDWISNEAYERIMNAIPDLYISNG